jgi:hypothetical protein
MSIIISAWENNAKGKKERKKERKKCAAYDNSLVTKHKQLFLSKNVKLLFTVSFIP